MKKTVKLEANKRWKEFMEEGVTVEELAKSVNERRKNIDNLKQRRRNKNNEDEDEDEDEDEQDLYDNLSDFEDFSGGKVKLKTQSNLKISSNEFGKKEKYSADDDDDDDDNDNDYDAEQKDKSFARLPANNHNNHIDEIEEARRFLLSRAADEFFIRNNGNNNIKTSKATATPKATTTKTPSTPKTTTSLFTTLSELDSARRELLGVSTTLKQNNRALKEKEAELIEREERLKHVLEEGEELHSWVQKIAEKQREVDDTMIEMEESHHLEKSQLQEETLRLTEENDQLKHMMESMAVKEKELIKRLERAEDGWEDAKVRLSKLNQRNEMLHLASIASNRKQSNHQGHDNNSNNNNNNNNNNLNNQLKQANELIFALMESSTRDSNCCSFPASTSADLVPKMLPGLYHLLQSSVCQNDKEYEDRCMKFIWSCLRDCTSNNHSGNEEENSISYQLSKSGVVATTTIARLVTKMFTRGNAKSLIFSSSLSTRIIASLIICKYSTAQVDMLDAALDRLKTDLLSVEGRQCVLLYGGVKVLTVILRSNSQLNLVKVTEVFLTLCSAESNSNNESLSMMIDECGNEEWFKSCAMAMERNILEVQENLIVLLQRISKQREYCKFFKIRDLHGKLLQLKTSTTSEFLKINIAAILAKLN